MKRQVITEDAVRRAAREGGLLQAEEDAIITPAARDALRDLGVELRRPGRVQGRVPRVPAFRVVGVACDHGGVLVKEWVCKTLADLGMEYRDHGVDSAGETADYPDKAAEIARKVQEGTYWRGVVIDGAGIGSAITANKFAGIRAGMAYDTLTAINARAHNNINILSLGGQFLGQRTVTEIVRLFIQTEFEGGRHQRRIDKIQKIDDEERRS